MDLRRLLGLALLAGLIALVAWSFQHQEPQAVQPAPQPALPVIIPGPAPCPAPTPDNPKPH